MHNLKLVGALLIVASSSWVGIRAAHSLRRLQSALNGFSAALEQMRSELAFTQSGFAELCASLGKAGEPESARFFTLLGADVSAEGFQPVGATRRAAERFLRWSSFLMDLDASIWMVRCGRLHLRLTPSRGSQSSSARRRISDAEATSCLDSAPVWLL